MAVYQQNRRSSSDPGTPTDILTTEIGFNESENAIRESKNAIGETDFASNAPRTTSLLAKMITTKAKSVSRH